MGTFEMTVGKLLCGKVRGILNGCKFKGMDITFLETKGWLENDFIIKGSAEDLTEVYNAFEQMQTS